MNPDEIAPANDTAAPAADHVQKALDGLDEVLPPVPADNPPTPLSEPAPPVAAQPRAGLFPWDKVFLELNQRGINVLIDTNAEGKTVGITASRDVSDGMTAHHSATFAYDTPLEAYEAFATDAINALHPDAA